MISPVEMLGWTGSVLVVVSLTQSNLRSLRLINLAASTIHLVFNLILGIPPMIALNLVLVGVNGCYLVGAPVISFRRLRTAAVPAHTHLVGTHRAALPLTQGFRYR